MSGDDWCISLIHLISWMDINSEVLLTKVYLIHPSDERNMEWEVRFKPELTFVDNPNTSYLVGLTEKSLQKSVMVN